MTESDAKYLTALAEKSSIPEPEDASVTPIQPFYLFEAP